MHVSGTSFLRRWPSLLGVVLAYVLVVQALVAPLHALAGVTLAGDRSLAVICLSHEHDGVSDEAPARPADMTCCELGCLSSLPALAVPVRGSGEAMAVPRLIGAQVLDTGIAEGLVLPERTGGQRHPPRAPPVSLALI